MRSKNADLGHYCINDIKLWLEQKKKTEYFLFATSKLKLTVRNLGVTFDSSLKSDKQIDSVVKASFF